MVMKRTAAKKDYGQIANKLRMDAIMMIHKAPAAHVASNLSPADIIAVLYEDILNVDPKKPDDPDRDRFLMSKGHATSIIWAVLAHKGFISHERLYGYYKDNGLGGHVTKLNTPGVELSTGSLGHALPFACGVALAGKRAKKNYRVFVMLSDGELDEGSNWEAILFAQHFKLDNLTIIIDYNKIQSLARVEDTINLEPLAKKFEAFNWATKEIDGHNHEEILKTLESVPFQKDRPSCIIAHTVKGKGVKFMEDSVGWHYWNTKDEQIPEIIKELGLKNYKF
jgi:transketolase